MCIYIKRVFDKDFKTIYISIVMLPVFSGVPHSATSADEEQHKYTVTEMRCCFSFAVSCGSSTTLFLFLLVCAIGFAYKDVHCTSFAGRGSAFAHEILQHTLFVVG